MAGHEKVSRREFLEKTGLAAAAVPVLAAAPGLAPAPGTAAGALPRRPLGKTGVSVPILAMGCGSRFLMYGEDEASAVLETALGLGISYFDTAVDYGDGESERRVGRLMPTRRQDVLLATKVPPRARTRDAALREFEGSLRRLRTDHVDVLHLHGLENPADLAKMEAPDGALKALFELRDQKAARFVGITGHADGVAMAQAIERHDLDCVQMAMNPARAHRFEELALPAATNKNLGIILMKVTGQELLLGPDGAPPELLLRYGWSLPVSTVVCGMPRREHIETNVALARAFTPMPPAEMDGLRSQLAGRRTVLDHFFAHHRDLA